MQQSLRIEHPPVGPSRETVLRPGALIQTTAADGRRQLVTWCRQTRAGAVYHADLELWSITVPIALDAFLQSLADRGYALPDGPDRQIWLEIVSGAADAQH